MTWWMYPLAYLAIGFVVAMQVDRLIGLDDEHDGDEAGHAVVIMLAWPLAFIVLFGVVWYEVLRVVIRAARPSRRGRKP